MLRTANKRSYTLLDLHIIHTFIWTFAQVFFERMRLERPRVSLCVHITYTILVYTIPLLVHVEKKYGRVLLRRGARFTCTGFLYIYTILICTYTLLEWFNVLISSRVLGACTPTPLADAVMIQGGFCCSRLVRKIHIFICLSRRV